MSKENKKEVCQCDPHDSAINCSNCPPNNWERGKPLIIPQGESDSQIKGRYTAEDQASKEEECACGNSADLTLVHRRDKPCFAEREERKCECAECKIKPHYSDCAVHNEPAEKNGKCTCHSQQSSDWEERFDTKYLGDTGIGCWTKSWSDDIKSFIKETVSLAEQRILESKSKEVESMMENYNGHTFSRDQMDAVLNILRRK